MPSLCLLGAIAGDVIGSVYEFCAPKSTDFDLFTPKSAVTDDTILTLAVAEAILDGGRYLEFIRDYARRFPNESYGGRFHMWMYTEPPRPYNSYGNGSAMRVSAVGWAFETPDDVLREAQDSAAVTHDHPEGVKGAQAVALAVLRARTGASKEAIRSEITARFGYDLSRTLAEIRPGYSFDETCQGTVPQAMTAFFEAQDFEAAVRLAVSLGGDADTLAAISGSIAEAFFGGIPSEIAAQVQARVPAQLWQVVERFSREYAGHRPA